MTRILMDEAGIPAAPLISDTSRRRSSWSDHFLGPLQACCGSWACLQLAADSWQCSKPVEKQSEVYTARRLSNTCHPLIGDKCASRDPIRRILQKGCSPDLNAGTRDCSKLPYCTWVRAVMLAYLSQSMPDGDAAPEFGRHHWMACKQP